MRDKSVKLLSTFFYIGNFPFAPGTLASAAGLLICIALHKSVFLYLFFMSAITVIGFMVSGRMEEILKKKDPGCVVIDEVAGIMVSFFLLPLTLPVVLTTFFLFRAFDMFKIYPCNKIEESGGAAGIMMDDVVAGLYTNVVMHIAIRFTGIM